MLKTKQDFIDFILNERTFKASLEHLDDEGRRIAFENAIKIAENISNTFIPLFELLGKEQPELLKKQIAELFNKHNKT